MKYHPENAPEGLPYVIEDEDGEVIAWVRSAESAEMFEEMGDSIEIALAEIKRLRDLLEAK